MPATLEAYLAEVAEGMLVASDEVARLLWHLSYTAARLDAAYRRTLEWIRGLSDSDLAVMRTHPGEVTGTEMWAEAGELRDNLLRLKVHLLNATRRELGATKGDTFTGIDDDPPQQEDSATSLRTPPVRQT